MQWSDVDPAEQAQILQFCTDTIANMGPAYVAVGGSAPGAIVDAILVGSWANNMALPLSDYDIVFISNMMNPFVVTPDPNGYQKGLMRKYMLSMQRDYPLPSYRFIDARIITANMCYPQNPIFGFSLLDGTVYTALIDLVAKYGV